ncbi:HP1 family phage holin [Shewanella surugensis]|uniref:Phage holin family protein n=1 Tax=Shewanella surugensis TaxID=212020 RepID=A0ABT0LG87_9GAMM|nr:HP1 family phage holin [Shewanella surugensis]MCL1126722.1 phage holin family protein [Shewanella surugensis]
MSEPTIQKAISTAAYSASVSTAAGSVLTTNDWILAASIGLAVLTFAINWMYRVRQDKRDDERAERDKEQHDLAVQLLEQQLKNG